MAVSIADIRDGFKSTIEANIPSLTVYDTVPEVTNVPCVVVMPESANFLKFAGSCSQWKFDLHILVSRVDSPRGQDSLDGYIDGTGANSIRQVLKNNPTLGLADVDVTVETMSGYGGNFDSMGVKYIGAVLRVDVLVTA